MLLKVFFFSVTYKLSCFVHVRYCADKGRHSWVPVSSIISFLGLSDFARRGREITPEVKKLNPKYAAAFSIKPSIKLKWDDAVAEASGLMAKTVEARIELFKPKAKNNGSLDKWLNSSGSIEENSKKRKVSVDDDVSSKRSKPNVCRRQTQTLSLPDFFSRLKKILIFKILFFLSRMKK